MSRSGIWSACAAVAMGILAMTGPVQGAADVRFSANRDLFHEHAAGDTAGPFLDTESGFAGTITTLSVTDSAGSPGAQIRVAADGSQTGVNNQLFDGLESWTFSWNVGSQLLEIDYSGMNSEGIFGIQSDAWIGADIQPGSTLVTFDPVTGTFSLWDGNPGDTYTQANLYGSSEVPLIPAGTGIRIYSISGHSFAIGSGFTFALVPEPATLSLLSGIAGALLMRPRRRT